MRYRIKEIISVNDIVFIPQYSQCYFWFVDITYCSKTIECNTLKEAQSEISQHQYKKNIIMKNKIIYHKFPEPYTRFFIGE